MLPQIASRIVQLDQYVAQASGKDVPEQIQSNLSRFGAVLLCGLIERAPPRPQIHTVALSAWVQLRL
jgi:hypothetical protein